MNSEIKADQPLDEIVFNIDTLYAFIDDAKHFYNDNKFERKIPDFLKKPLEQSFFQELTDTRSYEEKSEITE